MGSQAAPVHTLSGQVSHSLPSASPSADGNLSRHPNLLQVYKPPSKAERGLLPGASQTCGKEWPKGSTYQGAFLDFPSSRLRKHTRVWDTCAGVLLQQTQKTLTVVATVTPVRQIAGGVET